MTIEVREIQQCIDDNGLEGEELFNYLKEYIGNSISELSSGSWTMEDLAEHIEAQD